MKRLFISLFVTLVGALALMAQTPSVSQDTTTAATPSVALSKTVYTSPMDVPNPRLADAKAYVSNPDGILKPEEVYLIDRYCAVIDSLTEVELCVVVLNSIGDLAPFEFALELFNHWGVGKKDKNTGLMLFLTLDSSEGRHVRFITGDGIEGLLPDGLATQIIDEDMIPVFQEGGPRAYANMLLSGVKAVGRIVTTPEAKAELLLDQKLPEPDGQPWTLFSWLSILGPGAYIGNFYRKYKKCPHCGERSYKVLKSETLRRATTLTEGEGLRMYLCIKCGHTHKENYTIPRVEVYHTGSGGGGGGYSSGGRSSYSSGGGGSFGGGHSSGGGGGRSF